MPNCFQLINKTTGEVDTFASIDIALCELLGKPIHPTRYVNMWYNSVGLMVSAGKTLEDIRLYFQGYIEEGKKAGEDTTFDEENVRIVDYLIEHYTTDAWYSPV